MTTISGLETDDEWLYSAKTILLLHYNDDISDEAALRMLTREINRERDNVKRKIFEEGKRAGIMQITFNIRKKEFKKEYAEHTKKKY